MLMVKRVAIFGANGIGKFHAREFLKKIQKNNYFSSSIILFATSTKFGNVKSGKICFWCCI